MSQRHEQNLWGIVLAGGEGTRVRDFLRRLCGGRGIKQFCTIIGRDSLLGHTLARIERLIPRERILVVVSQDHEKEVQQQLGHWPTSNVIYQPANRDTLPGILLPLTYISQRDSSATVAVFPSDHFVIEEEQFMHAVKRLAEEAQASSEQLILLGATPNEADGDYGWIVPASRQPDQESQAVVRFIEKPSSACAQELMVSGALWNTFVFAGQSTTLWEMARRVAPDLYYTFSRLHRVLNLKTSYAPLFTEYLYERMRAVNFSSGVCEPLVPWLRVLPAPEVGWSDWGTAKRILASLQRIGKLRECLAGLGPGVIECDDF